MRILNDRLHEDRWLPNILYCPYCNGSMNTATELNAEQLEPGDFGICVGCGEICMHEAGNDGKFYLRKHTEQDIQRAKELGAYDLLMEYQHLIRNTNHGLKVKR